MEIRGGANGGKKMESLGKMWNKVNKFQKQDKMQSLKAIMAMMQ